ncbi:trans-2-enoyl-CoA reductase family protein [Paenibacillus sp. IB182496]|uniref:Trans-2-enoyl-CoA reductase [NADH] n=1 Tax=Paenibacillus sabuli TaxID=2772509 RepID=A0A927GRC7_9BACL|nr:enoyl-ACP reductase FabV [Paenibacillus sabuli]MBD2845489.1 trans-2-enoyl-CoA reductase family protein [Paenibacillus sabuli]
MIIQPRTRGFICTTAHPLGCAAQVRQQIEYVRARPAVKGPRSALIIGASTGYGLSARIAAAFGAGAATIGVYRPSQGSARRTASAGWYNSAAFEQAAAEAGLISASVTGDAFDAATKAAAIAKIRALVGQVDLVVYSVATARRIDPQTGEARQSVLKPLGAPYTNKTVNFHTGEISTVTIEPGTEAEVADTVAVMGGDDWAAWIDALREAEVLSPDAGTVAYSYIGSAITQAIYRAGTIGAAKDDLERTAQRLDERLSSDGGRAYVAVTKALVTQSSSAIPVVPLYVSVLYKVMKEKGLHEGCIEQSYRLLAERLYADGGTPVDREGRIRLDDLELREDVQAEVTRRWDALTGDNLGALADLEGYRREFFRLFGFEMPGIDYEADVDPEVAIPAAVAAEPPAR